jgi:hypothetical protein
METQSMDRWRAIVRGLCVVKIPQSSALFKGAQNKKRAIQVCAVYPQSPSARARPNTWNTSPAAPVSKMLRCRVAEDARQHDALLSYILPLPPPENLSLLRRMREIEIFAGAHNRRRWISSSRFPVCIMALGDSRSNLRGARN